MSEKCFCHFNGYVVKDATARRLIAELEQRIANLENAGGSGDGVSGTWIFNDTLRAPDELNYENITYSVNFTHDSTDYTSITFADTHDVSFGFESVYTSSSGWGTIDAPNPVITIAEGQTLSTEFITWLKANAVKLNG